MSYISEVQACLARNHLPSPKYATMGLLCRAVDKYMQSGNTRELQTNSLIVLFYTCQLCNLFQTEIPDIDKGGDYITLTNLAFNALGNVFNRKELAIWSGHIVHRLHFDVGYVFPTLARELVVSCEIETGGAQRADN